MIVKSSSSPRRSQRPRGRLAAEHLVLRLGRRERAEVVLAERAARRQACERLLVERARPPERFVSRSSGARTAPVEDDGSGRREPSPRTARGSRRGRLLGADDGDVVRAAPRSAPRPAGRPAARPPPSTLATCPVACTPASVRPATASPLPAREDARRAPPARHPRPSARPGCRAQPRKPVPSYSSVRRRVGTAPL